MGRQSLYLTDDGGREELQGAASGVGELPGVREGLVEGVTGCELPNPARSEEGENGSRWIWKRRGQQSQGVYDGVSREGRAKDLTS